MKIISEKAQKDKCDAVHCHAGGEIYVSLKACFLSGKEKKK